MTGLGKIGRKGSKSQHDCTVIELRAASGPAPLFGVRRAGATSSGPCSDNGANQFPIALADPPGALLPAVSFLGGFRTPALVPVDRSALAGIRNPSQNPPTSPALG